MAACTLKACLTNTQPQAQQCEEGARWRQDCNWCTCANGHGVCTLKACWSNAPSAEEVAENTPTTVIAPIYRVPIAFVDFEICMAGASWTENGCDSCNCAEEGNDVMCSKSICQLRKFYICFLHQNAQLFSIVLIKYHISLLFLFFSQLNQIGAMKVLFIREEIVMCVFVATKCHSVREHANVDKVRFLLLL